MPTTSIIMRLAAIVMAAGCTVSPPKAPTSATPPAPTAASSSPHAGPSPLEIDPKARRAETERLRALGLDIPAAGLVLERPFARPWTRRSLIVPMRWLEQSIERLRTTESVVASALLDDLDVLEAVMSTAYSGWESAEDRGWDWEQWFDDWRAMLSDHGDDPLALEQAFAPMKALMDVQLDNHTNIPLNLRFGSVSQSATLAETPPGPCTRARHADGSEYALSPDDAAQHPKRAWRNVAYPSGRGALTQLECAGRWIEASAAWSGQAPAAALARTREDVPAYRRVSSDIALVRLPTPSRTGRARVDEILSGGLSRGTERALMSICATTEEAAPISTCSMHGSSHTSSRRD